MKMVKEEYRQKAEEIGSVIKDRLKAIMLAQPIFFKACALLCKEEFKMAADIVIIEEYLASSYWAGREVFGDQMQYQDERVQAAAKEMSEEEVVKLSIVSYLADEIEVEIEKEKQKRKKDFLARKKVGMILRVYATKAEDVSNRVSMIHEAVAAAYKATVDGHQLIKRIDVLVWSDENYADADCGLTRGALFESFFTDPDYPLHSGFHLSEVKHGDLFCGLLNYGVVHQLRHGCDYSLVISAEAFSYMTPETMDAMVNAACSGARAVGVAINELTQSIKDGRIANTFAMWHNESLMTVGGFDLRAAKPANEFSTHYMKGWSQEKKEPVFYHLAGVEEVIPLARLTETFGPCIAPILPSGEGVQQYQIPDPIGSPELWQRHISKMGTKLERQSALLAAIGMDISFLRGGVMPQYRQ